MSKDSFIVRSLMAPIKWSSSESKASYAYRGRKSGRYPQDRMAKIKVVLGFVIAIQFLFYMTNTNNLNSDQNSNASDLIRCGTLNFDVDTSKDIAAIDNISKMTELDLKGCNLKEIPATIQYATNLRKLDVSNNPLLSTFPPEMVHCTKLDILFASSCPSITSLPTVLGNMPSITRLGWRSGSLTELNPDGLPPNLVHLIMTHNKLKSLGDPRLFEKMKHVRKLMLSHNQLSSFGGKEGETGVEMLQNLELMRLGGNQLTEIPESLWKLPKLTWLTISGNPVTDAFAAKSKSNPSVPSIRMSDLKPTGNYLGQGASGKVESYQWQNKEVAVKLIHGVTSDGKAEDELSIYGAVGSSGFSNRVVGCLALLDDVRKGIVMDVLPSNLDDFALPPTIKEVTKDRWDTTSTFSASFVKNALQDSANALNFLHSKVGISHGDFYAHNMKVDKATGRVYLLDFGASYFKGEYTLKAEKLEIRAFGVLVTELIEVMDPQESLLREKLITLYKKCINEDVSARPTFSEIEEIVKTL